VKETKDNRNQPLDFTVRTNDISIRDLQVQSCFSRDRGISFWTLNRRGSRARLRPA
jgi:hypothetical protein